MRIANRIITVVAGLVLIIASALKIHQLLTEPIISKGLWESWLFFVFQIPLELGLGIWLVSGLFRKAVWMIAVLAFGLFILVTLQKGFIGAESCGCFGRVKVNPWITFSVIDIPIFLGLVIFRPKGLKLLPPPWPSALHFFGVAIPTFITFAIIMPVLVFNKPSDKTDKYEVVKPAEWISQPGVHKEWSMLEYIDIAGSLKSNIVVVMLYSNTCETCHEAIPLYDQMARDMAGNEDSIQFSLIEIPPYASEKDDIVPINTPCLRGKLDSSKKWYIQTPLVVVVQDGAAVKFWEGEIPQLDEILNSVQ
ncbi:MAG: MauE/DoxX family redox-associated membrane protein [Phycisphaerae bacterium]|jgi:thiol-disulfide isomerase/thioredoxin